MRLRSYILHMQEGSSLLLWRHDGLKVISPSINPEKSERYACGISCLSW